MFCLCSKWCAGQTTITFGWRWPQDDHNWHFTNSGNTWAGWGSNCEFIITDKPDNVNPPGLIINQSSLIISPSAHDGSTPLWRLLDANPIKTPPTKMVTSHEHILPPKKWAKTHSSINQSINQATKPPSNQPTNQSLNHPSSITITLSKYNHHHYIYTMIFTTISAIIFTIKFIITIITLPRNLGCPSDAESRIGSWHHSGWAASGCGWCTWHVAHRWLSCVFHISIMIIWCCVYIYILLYTVYMDGCMDAWMHGCMDGWMHVCMYVCMYVCIYV